MPHQRNPLTSSSGRDEQTHQASDTRSQGQTFGYPRWSSLRQVLHEADLARPDGRPLYRYSLAESILGELEHALRQALAGQPGAGRATAANFVIWAAETIRTRYPGGGLTWAFLFDRLDIAEDQDLGRRMVREGLAWWQRKVRLSDENKRMFLYSLMAEGGLPDAVLRQESLYKDVFLGLLREIEADGVEASKPWAFVMARRWVQQLPQTFRHDDVARLMADLALAVAAIRELIPTDIPADAGEQWLHRNEPDWAAQLPLRLRAETLSVLIRPALNEERHAPVQMVPLCGRELVRDGNGRWHARLALRQEGWLPDRLLPRAASNLRLRLLPGGSFVAARAIYAAQPQDGGWAVRRLGGRSSSVAYELDRPFSLTAHADGHKVGEAVIDSGVPLPDELPSLWRPAEANEDGEMVDRLTPLSSARTRKRFVWLLAPAETEPVAEGQVDLTAVGSAADGRLWRLSGNGVLRVAETRWRVATSGEDEGHDARIFAFGETIERWLLDGMTPVHHGEPTFWGQFGSAPVSRLPDSELHRKSGRRLGSNVIEWRRNDEVLARREAVHLPGSLQIQLRETGPGRATCRLQGLPLTWRAQLEAGATAVECAPVGGGSFEGTLALSGRRPGLVVLRLLEPASGRSLELQSPWPAATGMLLDPEGERLDRNRALSTEDLQGWRAISDQASGTRTRGALQFDLGGRRLVSVPASGEVSVASYQGLVEALLAQETSDGRVNVTLIVDGKESPRLEIGRYLDNSYLTVDGLLHLGLDRGQKAPPDLEDGHGESVKGHVELTAVDLRSTESRSWSEASSPVDLKRVLPSGGPWLVHSSLNDRPQRAAIRFTGERPDTTRTQRVGAYAERWRAMLDEPAAPEWDSLLKLVELSRVGHAGSFDQLQALAQVPAVALCLLFRTERGRIGDIFDLDSSIPVFWPGVLASDFTTALRVEGERVKARLVAGRFDEDKATLFADQKLVNVLEALLLQRPALAAHWSQAFVDAGLLSRQLARRASPPPALLAPASNPRSQLEEAAQEAAKRLDRLPQGVGGLTPNSRPAWLSRFSSVTQPLIDAPLVSAEMAAGLREQPATDEKTTLIHLRWLDPLYFEKALPAAVTHYLGQR